MIFDMLHQNEVLRAFIVLIRESLDIRVCNDHVMANVNAKARL